MRTLSLLVLSVLALIALPAAHPATASEPPARPNIIVIYTDDQGFGDSSHLNPASKFATPHLDRLATEGLSFTNAHSSDSVCTPSRYGLLAGRYAWRTTLKQGVLKADEPCLIADGRMTLATMLRDVGYDTAMVGKWHLGMDIPGTLGDRDWSQPIRDMPLDHGFDYFYGIPASLNFGVLAWFEGRFAKVPPAQYTAKKPNDRHVDYRIQPPYQDSAQEAREVLERGPIEVAPDFIDNQCLTRFTDKAIAWMAPRAEAAANGKPFFLYLPYTSPHYPVCPLPAFHGQGEAGGYGEFMVETDHHVGRLLAFLKESGLDENTMVVFSSDNGPEDSWEGRIKQFGHHSNHVYRNGKRSFYEGGHRVPFFIRWPAGIAEPGRSWDRLVGQVDLLATLAELVGVALPDHAGEDSQSFLSVLKSARADVSRVPLINHGFKGRFTVTHGDWKLVLPGAEADAELYDLAADPSESHDLIADHPERAAELRARATDIVVQGRSTPGAAQANDTGHWTNLHWISPEQYARRHRAAVKP